MIIPLQLVYMSGILAGLFFILNFTTCYSMPWSKKCDIAHTCKGKERDKKKKMLCQHHKPLAWLTIITGVIHMVLGLLY